MNFVYKLLLLKELRKDCKMIAREFRCRKHFDTYFRVWNNVWTTLQCYTLSGRDTDHLEGITVRLRVNPEIHIVHKLSEEPTLSDLWMVINDIEKTNSSVLHT